MSTAIAIAPGRVNLIGEHTDYAGGLCLPFAIQLTTAATVTARNDRQVTILSDQGEPWSGDLDDVAGRDVSGWARYVAGVIWALGELGWEVPGLDIAITSTIPLGGGLSSSAALECAVATAITGLLGVPVDDRARRHLANVCRRAETEYVGAPTGGMDQFASMLGVAGHALLLDFSDVDVPGSTVVPFPVIDAGLALLVTDTGVRHQFAAGGGYAERRAEAGRALAAPQSTDPILRARRRHLATENDRVRGAVDAIGRADWATLGAQMTASHASLRDDYEVSCAELDLVVEAALAAGALGARLTGGGFGGCTITLVDASRLDDVRAGIGEAFAAGGHAAPVQHVVRPGAGARLVSAGRARG